MLRLWGYRFVQTVSALIDRAEYIREGKRKIVMAFLSNPGFGSVKAMLGLIVGVALATFVLQQFQAGRNILSGNLTVK